MWTNDLCTSLNTEEEKEITDIVDDILMRYIGSLIDIYKICHVVMFEPINYEEAKSDEM